VQRRREPTFTRSLYCYSRADRCIASGIRFGLAPGLILDTYQLPVGDQRLDSTIKGLPPLAVPARDVK
jgi:hypothetical protein